MKGVKLMKNEITLERLIEFNQSYHQQHGVTESDLEKCLEIVKVFNDARDSQKSALAGDVVILKGTNKTYDNGHIEGVNVWGKIERRNRLSICVKAYIPFVKITDYGYLLDTSGGYWLGAEPHEFKDTGETREKLFKAWGHCGMTGNGAFYFPYEVKVWELESLDIY